MNNLSNLIGKNHNVLLKNFSHLSKPSNVAESEHVNVFLAWNQRVEVLFSLVDVGCDNLGACFPEAKAEMFSDFS